MTILALIVRHRTIRIAVLNENNLKRDITFYKVRNLEELVNILTKSNPNYVVIVKNFTRYYGETEMLFKLMLELVKKTVPNASIYTRLKNEIISKLNDLRNKYQFLANMSVKTHKFLPCVVALYEYEKVREKET